MRLAVFGRNFKLQWGKIILGLIIFLFAVGTAAFVRQVYIYYQAIIRGESNPILDQQLQSSLSRIKANAQVTPDDLARLANQNAPTLGPVNAPLSIVVFMDYGCPYSRTSAQPIRRLAARYPTQVRFSIRDFPLDDQHPQASAAAMAARCAQEQGRFWPYFDLLFANQGKFEEEDLKGYANQVGADSNTFNACLLAQTPGEKIVQDMEDALGANVEGTPTFFFNGVRIQGGLDEKSLDYLIRLFLAPPKK